MTRTWSSQARLGRNGASLALPVPDSQDPQVQAERSTGSVSCPFTFGHEVKYTPRFSKPLGHICHLPGAYLRHRRDSVRHGRLLMFREQHHSGNGEPAAISAGEGQAAEQHAPLHRRE